MFYNKLDERIEMRHKNLRPFYKRATVQVVISTAILYSALPVALLSQNGPECTVDSPCDALFRIQADSFARMYRNGEIFYDKGGGGGGGRSFNVAAIDPINGELLEPVQNFDNWGLGKPARIALLEYLSSFEMETLFIVAVADDAGELTEDLLSAFEELGSERLRDYTFRHAWVMSAIKGNGRAIVEVLSDDRWDMSREILIDIEFLLRFPLAPIFADGFESGNTSAWTGTVP